jgi:hypothetical protein
MDENQFEDIIEKYPELIEEGLRFEGRQIYLNENDRNYIDLLFKDRLGNHLIIELKVGSIKPEHIDQIRKYEEIYNSLHSKKTRIMLVGNKVNERMMRILERDKVEYKELKISEIKIYLKKRSDNIFLRYFDKNQQNKRKARKSGEKIPRHERVGVLTGRNIWNTRGGTYQNRFCNLIIDAGDKGVSMAEAQNVHWNPNHYHFYDSVKRLKKRGYVQERNSRYYVTKKGLNNIHT